VNKESVVEETKDYFSFKSIANKCYFRTVVLSALQKILFVLIGDMKSKVRQKQYLTH